MNFPTRQSFYEYLRNEGFTSVSNGIIEEMHFKTAVIVNNRETERAEIIYIIHQAISKLKIPAYIDHKNSTLTIIFEEYDEEMITIAQIRYLKFLLKRSGYIIKAPINMLTKKQASDLISFFVNDTELPTQIKHLLEYDI